MSRENSDGRLERLSKRIAGKYSSMAESLDGKRVRYIKPARGVGVRHCFLFENGVVLEIGVPIDSKTFQPCYDYKEEDKIVEAYDIYDIKELQERLKAERNSQRIVYYKNILKLYEDGLFES